MKKLPALILCVLCVFAGNVLAQGYSETADAKARPNERPATFEQLKAKALKANDLVVGYDKFKDESTVMAMPAAFHKSSGGVLNVLAGVSPDISVAVIGIEARFAGRTLRETPGRFAIVIAGISRDWQWFREDGRLYFLMDGERRFALDPDVIDHSLRRGGVEETIGFVVTREQLRELVGSKTTEMRVGKTPPAVLKPKLLAAWAALLDVTQLEPVP